MRSPDGRPFVPADQAGTNKGLQRQVDILDRRTARIPRAEAATPAGGIVDIAKLSSTATFPSFAGIRWPSGDTESDHFDTTYGAVTSTVTGEAASWLTVDLGGITPTEDGFYQAWCWVELRWPSLAAACGSGATFYLNGRDVPGNDLRPVLENDVAAGVVSAYVTNGPEWMTTADTWRLEVQGLAATSAELSQSSASWRIVHYGTAS
jgi:hypothetical protein